MTEIHMVKQIDNSRLVKELDFQKTRECLLLMILAMLCLLVLLCLAWQQFEVIRRGYEREELRKEIKHLAEIERQLKLERATLRSPQRIDLIARKQLGLISPSFHQIVVQPPPEAPQPAEILVAVREGGGMAALPIGFGAHPPSGFPTPESHR